MKILTPTTLPHSVSSNLTYKFRSVLSFIKALLVSSVSCCIVFSEK